MRRIYKTKYYALLVALLQLSKYSVHSQTEDEETTPGDQLKATSTFANNGNETTQGSSIAITCDFNNDPCPSQFNRICEAGIPNGCPADTDCFDCDPCHQFHLDCQGCVDHGCLYCPTDALCTSAPLETPVWRRIEFLFHTTIVPSCVTADDYVSECRSSTSGSSGDSNVFPDPLYDAMQWVYDLIHVEPVWQRGILGTGVRIRINDNGVDSQHPEFDGRFDVEASCPGSTSPRGAHGTAVASVAAGGANDVCAVGIAPNATLSACAMTLQTSIHPEILAAVLSAKLSDFDISVNSWGMATCIPILPQRRLQDSTFLQPDCPFQRDHPYSPCHFCDFEASPNRPSSRTCLTSIVYYCAERYENDPESCSDYLDMFTVCSYNSLTPEEEQALTEGVQQGRDGKGVIFVFAAGNSYNLGVDANFDGWTNSRYTIAVAAVGKDGKHASYSTPGSVILVAGPGGDRESITNNIVAVAGSNGCGDMTIGTSFSAPYVAGVIALMLEANPELTWRDVQGILAATSTQVDPEAWTNAAGFQHSYEVGFGIANAEAAVNAAETWQLWGEEREIRAESGIVDLNIVDDETSTTTSVITINDAAGADFVVETVVVNISLAHASRGDLSIVLTSPSGTASILHPGKRPENTVMAESDRWKLMTVRNWGESPVGNWSLALVDQSLGILDDCVDLPFEYTLMDEDAQFIFTCSLLELMEACNQRAVNPDFSNILGEGTNAAENACCACGGGGEASAQSFLRSWELLIFGRERVSEQPSGSPTVFPTTASPRGAPPIASPPTVPPPTIEAQRLDVTEPNYSAARSSAAQVSMLVAAVAFVLAMLINS